MIKYIKKNVKVIVIFIICMIITGVISAYAATVISASEVSYTSNGQTTVQGAIDDLYSLSSSWINPSYINFTTLDTNVNQTILASSDGICIKRNGKVSCIKRNNWAVEKDHVQEIFSDISCSVSSSSVVCIASDFRCGIYSGGHVFCDDRSDRSSCDVESDGKVECTKALDSNSIDFSTLQTNTAKTVLASSKGVCINRNGMLHCFKINNWNIEKNHIQRVFSDISCKVTSDYVDCVTTSDYNGHVYSDGTIWFSDARVYNGCEITSDGTINCN